jgi:hypothetical protein
MTDLLAQSEELEKTIRSMEPLRDDLKVNTKLPTTPLITSQLDYAIFLISLSFMNHS